VAACKKKTPNGFKYDLHKSGSGAKAAIGDVVTFDMLVKSGDSVLFNTMTTGQPSRAQLEDSNSNPDAFFKAVMGTLSILKVGDSATLYIPLDTFKVKPSGFEKAKVAEFTLTLRKVQTKTEMEARKKEQEAIMTAVQAAGPSFKARAKAVADSTAQISKAFGAGQLPANVKTVDGGLRIAVLKEGTGAQAKKGDAVFVNYYGCLKDGTNFDGSFERGEPFIFPLGAGQVIPGWDAGLAQMKEGTTAILFVPAAMGYGERQAGKIPANSDLVFYVELIKVVNIE
jgi:FKBP-type peptidyl-prolyl cis-trans isomerase FkpA